MVPIWGFNCLLCLDIHSSRFRDIFATISWNRFPTLLVFVSVSFSSLWILRSGLLRLFQSSWMLWSCPFFFSLDVWVKHFLNLVLHLEYSFFCLVDFIGHDFHCGFFPPSFTQLSFFMSKISIFQNLSFLPDFFFHVAHLLTYIAYLLIPFDNFCSMLLIFASGPGLNSFACLDPL